MGDQELPAVAEPGGSDVELPPLPGIDDSPELKMRWMDEHLWTEAKEILGEEGISNPTNAQIQAVDNALSVANNVKVIDPATGQAIWPQTVNGEIIDRVMQAGPIDASEATKLAKDIFSGKIIIK